MKSFKILATAIVLFLMVSCGGGSSTIEEVELIPIKSGNAWGYVDKDGNIKINPQFSALSLFKDGVALVKSTGEKGLYGYIDEKGSYLINPSFLSASEFTDGIAVVVAENEAPKAINKKGEVLFTLANAEQLQEFGSDGLAGYSVSSDDGKQKWGFVNKKGETKISPQFNFVSKFSEGKAAVRNDSGKWGYIDKEGKFLINPQFDFAANFKNGKAIVLQGTQKGIIDEKGTYVINPQFLQIWEDGNMYLVNSGGKFGWTDKEGKYIINPQFDEAAPFNGNSLAPARSGSSWGYIDKKGNFVINAQFDDAYPFNGDRAVVDSGGKIGFIDKKGKYLANPQFDAIAPAYSNYIYGMSKQLFSVVATDFFDVNAIVNRIKKDITPNSVAGFNFETPVGDMMTKYNKTESDFSYYYRDESYLIKDEKVGKYANLNLAITGSIYKSEGWSYVINPQAKVSGFLYTINLNGKATNKTDQIMKSFENAFSGYTKRAESSENVLGFISDQQLIVIEGNSYKISIAIVPAKNISNDDEDTP